LAVVQEDAMDMTVRLTGREAEVLRLLARGRTYAQAADQLGMSAHTVATHVKNAYRKLDVHSAAAAVMRAIELRLLEV
jgi:DNA-binding CsgD family transcriptional regulator